MPVSTEERTAIIEILKGQLAEVPVEYETTDWFVHGTAVGYAEPSGVKLHEARFTVSCKHSGLAAEEHLSRAGAIAAALALQKVSDELGHLPPDGGKGTALLAAHAAAIGKRLEPVEVVS